MKKTGSILLLMITSGLLLALFVARWLQSEYNSERDELQKTIFEQFIAAKSRVTDTLISKNLIDPILNSPGGFKLETVDKWHMESDTVKVITSNLNTDSLHRMPKDSDDLQLSYKVSIEEDSNILYNGVKLFIREMHGPEMEDRFFERYIDPGDTTMLKTFFAQNLDSLHINVKQVWTSEQTDREVPHRPFFYESHFFESPFAVRIEGYNRYITAQITPQFIFAVLLLLSVITAFVFSYRSLRSQMRLAEMKDDLMSNISHELKTPVATVKVALEAIMQMDATEQKEKMKDYLRMAAQETDRLDLLVSKVMNSIISDNGKQLYRKEVTDLALLIDETIATVQLQLKQSAAEIHFTNETKQAPILADAMHIKGVLYNLIDNSIKYGGQGVQIQISLSRTEHEITLLFSDNGAGIPDEYRNRIFDKFFRVPAAEGHLIKGSGLGLYYAAQVMRQSGGSIQVKNNSGSGVSFTLKFPVYS